MANEPKIPLDELSGKVPLDGTYKVTFELDINSGDDVSVTELIQAVASSLEDSKLMNRVANMEFEKKGYATKLSVGDKVRLSRKASIRGIISNEGDYKILRSASELENTINVEIPKGINAVVNQVVGDDVELIDIASAVDVDFDICYDEKYDLHDTITETVNLENIIVKKDNLEKLEDK